MIPCSTYLVTRGWFDIFFPTDFEMMQRIYGLIAAKKGKSDRQTRVATHRDFLQQYGDLEASRTQSGENPMVEHYQNVKFFLT
jgi:hypothetical protein